MHLYKNTIALFAVFVTGASYAQNNVSPYSIAGIGDIESGWFDRSAGMANTGVSLSSPRYIYQANPASLSKLDDYFFSFELSGRYQYTRYTGKPVGTGTSTYADDMQIKRLALGLKVKKWWGIGIGLTPFSTSNYSFYSKKDIQGSGDKVDAYYEGSGGINQVYITNAFRLNKNFSVGVQSSVLFGSLQQTETLDYNSSSAIASTRDIYVSKMYFKGGIQYQADITKKVALALGLTASNKTTLPAEYTLTVKEGSTTIVDNKSIKDSYFSLPVIYTAGAALIFNKQFTVSADYQQQNWNSVNYSGLNYTLVNSNRVSGGVEYAKKISYANRLIERWYLQAGGFYSNSYLQIKGEQLNDRGFTVGAGFSTLRSQLALQANLQIGQRGTTNSGLIKENYTQVGFSVFYRDFWLPRKLKRYD
ncbi:hypothetical protein [Foetidibacter luteolus]|uniref:hypothetical protein n=1 Tax=Foetidibacter luteolus TaxID=2608880 RepID=UPI00129BB38A|nr:hypothetical protein [Foetidibacter luteolus]